MSHSRYDATEFGLATTVHFTYRAYGAIMNLKNTCGKNINLHIEQDAAMKAGFHGIDGKWVMSAEKQVTDAVNTGRKRRQVAQAGISTRDGSYEVWIFLREVVLSVDMYQAFKHCFLHIVLLSVHVNI